MSQFRHIKTGNKVLLVSRKAKNVEYLNEEIPIPEFNDEPFSCTMNYELKPVIFEQYTIYECNNNRESLSGKT